MPCPRFDKRARISNSSVSPGVTGVLWPPAIPPHACLHTAYCGLPGPLRAIFGHRGPFRAVEEIVFPRTPFSRGVDISSGRSRNMAHRRDRISIWHPEEGVRRLAFGVVLYGRRPAAGSSSDRPPKFSNAPLKKRLSWRPRSPQREDDGSFQYLMGRIRLLAHSGLTMIGVMATCIMRGV